MDRKKPGTEVVHVRTGRPFLGLLQVSEEQHCNARSCGASGPSRPLHARATAAAAHPASRRRRETNQAAAIPSCRYIVPALARDTGGVRPWAKNRVTRTIVRGGGGAGLDAVQSVAHPNTSRVAGRDATARWRAPTG